MHSYIGGTEPVCRLTLVFPGGSSEFGSELPSRVALSQMMQGTSAQSAEDLAEIIDYNGIKISATCHAHYSSLTLSMLSHRISDFLPVLRDMLLSPTYPEDKLSIELSNVKAAIATARSNVASLASEEFGRLMYGADHPAAKVLTDRDVDAVTRDVVFQSRNRLFESGAPHAFLSGLIDEVAINEVENFLSSLPKANQATHLNIIPYSAAGAGSIVRTPYDESLQAAISCGLPTIPRQSPDYNMLRVAVMALGGYFGSRLMKNIREDKGYTYGIASYLLGSQEGSVIQIAAQCDKAYTEAVTDEIRAEMKSLVSDPPTGEELQRLILHCSSTLARQLDTPQSVMSYYQTALLVDAPADYFESQCHTLSQISSDNIAEMSALYMNPDFLRVAIVG